MGVSTDIQVLYVSSSYKSCPNLFIFLKTGELMNLQTLDLSIKYLTLEGLDLSMSRDR